VQILLYYITLDGYAKMHINLKKKMHMKKKCMAKLRQIIFFI